MNAWAAASSIATRRISSTRCGSWAAGSVRSVRAMVGRWMKERPCPGNFSAYLEFEDGTPATIVYNGYGYFDTSELTWGIGNRMYTDAERVPVRQALHAAARSTTRPPRRACASAPPRRLPPAAGARIATAKPVGTRAHIGWFGVTRGELRARRHPPVAQRSLYLRR